MTANKSFEAAMSAADESTQPKSNGILSRNAHEAERFALEAIDQAALMDTGVGGELAHARAAKAARIAADAYRAAGSHTRAGVLANAANAEADRAQYVEDQRQRFLGELFLLRMSIDAGKASNDATRDTLHFWGRMHQERTRQLETLVQLGLALSIIASLVALFR